MLYLVATPIGNLKDTSFRAIEILKECDYILCEDTRHSLILLNHYQIQRPLKSYHKFNESSQAQIILDDLRQGKQICLISDAGTPGISDPGADLVKLCIDHQLPVTAIPGPCAAIQALICSGLSTNRFQFCGFLPKKKGELKSELQKLLCYEGTTICYESPHRILESLETIKDIQPERLLVVARELTKKFEEIVRGSAAHLIEHWQLKPPKGEVILLISGAYLETQHDWNAWSPQEHVQWLESTYGLDHKDAIKMVAELRGVPKREIYQKLHKDR